MQLKPGLCRGTHHTLQMKEKKQLDNRYLSSFPLCSLSLLLKSTDVNQTITLTECGKDTDAGWLTWGGGASASNTLVLSPVSWLSSFVSHLIALWKWAKSLQPTTVRLQLVETGAGSPGRRSNISACLMDFIKNPRVISLRAQKLV